MMVVKMYWNIFFFAGEDHNDEDEEGDDDGDQDVHHNF